MRIIFRSPSKLFLVGRMLRNTEVVHPNPNAASRHLFKEIVAADTAALFVNENSVKVISMTRFRLGFGGRHHGQVRESRVISIPDFLSPFPIWFHPAQLMNAERRL